MQDTKDMQSAQADSAPIQEMTDGMGSAEDGSAFEASSSASSASSAQEENALPDSEEANTSAVESAEEESCFFHIQEKDIALHRPELKSLTESHYALSYIFLPEDTTSSLKAKCLA